jgi:glycosyltransferase involved in cell wall biosynthesis
MNILVLDQFSEVGGAQRGLLDVLRAAQDRGWRAHVLVPGGGPLLEQLRSRQVAVDEIPCGPYRSGRKSPVDLLQFGLDVRRQVRVIGDLLKRSVFDLVYVNGPRVLPGAAIACRRLSPVLFHLHSHIEQGYTARLARWSVRRADATVIVCGHSVARSLGPCAAPDKLHVIANGTAEIAFRVRDFGGQGWCIGMVGRISPEKGQIEFLQAVALLRDEFSEARFVICGAAMFGMESYFELVRSKASGLRVEFLEWREDVASVFAELDLLVVPSKQEGMGRVLVEAFSAGVLAVAFPMGGIPDVVTDGETGFLTPQASPQALAAKIREIISSDPGRLRTVAANARSAWERCYTLAAYQNRITDLMERLVSDWRAEREKVAPLRHR